MNIILASSSPRRRELLGMLGWPFSVDVSDAKETSVTGEKPRDMVCRLARLKAETVYKRNVDSWVVGADTTVAINDEILGKPGNLRDAERMISTLSGKTHSVFTGVALFSPASGSIVKAEETRVRFRDLSDEEVRGYVSLGESMDKAGAYAIQEKGALLVSEITGCYFNVVGLPIYLLSDMFSKLGFPLTEQWRLK
ncbi:MAG: Maf family protein [Synergistaceae bacterium]|nr:Maf family protein [Synergistaceae bacterium]